MTRRRSSWIGSTVSVEGASCIYENVESVINLIQQLDVDIGRYDFTEEMFEYFLEEMINQIKLRPDKYEGTRYELFVAMENMLKEE